MLTSRRVRTARVSSLLGALLLLPVLSATAAPAELATTSARLEVQALPDCTTREELAARVAARSRRIHFDDGGAGGPTVRAGISRAPRGGAVGELAIVQPDGKTSSRRLSAASCAEATDAIALVIALTLDPMSLSAPASTSTSPSPPSAAAGRAGPSAPLPSAPPAGTTPPALGVNEPSRTPAETAPARTAAPARSAEDPTRTEREAPTSPPADREPSVVASPPAAPIVTQRRFGGGAVAQELFGLAPTALPGLGVYLMATLDREALWSPALVVAGTHAWSSGLAEPGGVATFTLDAITLDACALRLRFASAGARACGTALYGRLGAAGSVTYSPATAARPFAGAGGALLFSLELARFFELSGRLGASASLIRDSFAFTPAVFHRTAAVTIAAGLGVGVRFP